MYRHLSDSMAASISRLCEIPCLTVLGPFVLVSVGDANSPLGKDTNIGRVDCLTFWGESQVSTIDSCPFIGRKVKTGLTGFSTFRDGFGKGNKPLCIQICGDLPTNSRTPIVVNNEIAGIEWQRCEV